MSINSRLDGWMRTLGQLVGILCAAAVPLGVATPAAAAAPVVQTQEGPVQGTEKGGVNAFTTIPYAATPVGPLRFRAPQPVARWTQPYVATKEMPVCIQFGGGEGGRRGPEPSEDCLYLSVWAPATATRDKPVPVMVWIYGGGGISGSARGFDGTSLAKNGGVVVVTLNYRLGILSSLVDKSLDEPGTLSGNMAMRDHLAVLQWVQRNITGFGGDARNVTLFGQSSGAGAVIKLLSSPQSKGLVHKVIAMSSTGGGGAAARRETVQAGPTQNVIKLVGCEGRSDMAACLRSAPVSAYVAAYAKEAYRYTTLDPVLVPLDMHQAFLSGNFNRVPVLIGTNITDAVNVVLPEERRLGHAVRAEEYVTVGRRVLGPQADKVLAAYPMAKYPTPDVGLLHAVTDWRQACPNDTVRRSLSAFVPVYAIENAVLDSKQAPPDPAYSQLPNSARHGSENAYIWGARNGQPLAGDEAQLSERMQRYWSNFAKFGKPDPNDKEWLTFTVAQPRVLSLGLQPHVATDFTERHNCAFLRENKLIAD